MKKSIVVLFLIGLFANLASADNEITSFEEAKKEALRTNKLVFVDFWTQDCTPTVKVDIRSLTDDEINFLKQNFVFYTVKGIENNLAFYDYNIGNSPTIIITDANGVLVCKEMGYLSKSNIFSLIKKYAIDTSYLAQDMTNYSEKPSFPSAFRLATKYQNYSMLVDKEIKKNIIRASNTYFAKAKQFLAQSEIKNKIAFEQKLTLLEIQEKLILNKASRALKLLGKYKPEKVQSMNKKLYAFLNYTAYLMIGDPEYASDWIGELDEADKKKAKLFLKMT